MNKVFLNRTPLALGIPLLATLALMGCGTPAPKDFGGPWKPVNRFQEQPTAIPLNQTYVYFASPMDETLKRMLTRWAKDSGLALSYQLSADFTLYTPVAQIRTVDIRAAAAQLNSIYSAEGVHVTVSDRQILVTLASAPPPETSAGKASPGTPEPKASQGTKS